MFAFLALAAVPPISQASIDLSKVQVIDRTGTVRRSDLIRPSNGSKAAITVRGDGITVEISPVDMTVGRLVFTHKEDTQSGDNRS